MWCNKPVGPKPGRESGIGFAVAKAMGRMDAKVVITGRKQSALDENVARRGGY
jgi:short-subunit dehydrogenase involved in D-alanine esterification of teichoic acids